MEPAEATQSDLAVAEMAIITSLGNSFVCENTRADMERNGGFMVIPSTYIAVCKPLKMLHVNYESLNSIQGNSVWLQSQLLRFAIQSNVRHFQCFGALCINVERKNDTDLLTSRSYYVDYRGAL